MHRGHVLQRKPVSTGQVGCEVVQETDVGENKMIGASFREKKTVIGTRTRMFMKQPLTGRITIFYCWWTPIFFVFTATAFSAFSAGHPHIV